MLIGVLLPITRSVYRASPSRVASPGSVWRDTFLFYCADEANALNPQPPSARRGTPVSGSPALSITCRKLQPKFEETKACSVL